MTRKQLAIPVLILGLGPVPSNGFDRVRKLSRPRWDTMRNPALRVRRRFVQKRTGKISGGQCHTRLAKNTKMRPPKYVGFYGISFLDCQTAGTQILSLPGALGLPHAGCGQGGPGRRYCGSSSPHTAGNFTWIQNIFALPGFQLARRILLLSLSWTTVLSGRCQCIEAS